MEKGPTPYTGENSIMRAFLLFLSLAICLNGARVRAASHELLSNNNFESGATIWNAYALSGGDPLSAGITNLGNAHQGTWYAWLGDFNTSHFNAIGAVKQTVYIPSYTSTATLTFYLNVTSQETTSKTNYDKLDAYLRTYPGDVQAVAFHEWGNLDKDPNGIKTNYVLQAYTKDVSAYAGQTMTFQFYGITDGTLSTTFRVDDVSLKANIPDYTVGVSAGPNGSVNPSGNIPIEAGQTLNLTANPNAGYTVDQWLVNGMPVQNGGTTLAPIINSTAPILVTFKKITYVVGVSTGPNGGVNPSGNITVNYGDSLGLTATPNPDYVVDQWLTNGVVAQTGSNTFNTGPISSALPVMVTFKPLTHTITIVAENGDVDITPALGGYPHGANVSITVKAHAGYVFASWQGTFNSLANSLQFNIEQDISLSALFVKAATAPSMAVANSTPATSGNLTFSYPTTDGYKYVLYYSEDGFFWKPVTVKTGADDTDAIHSFPIITSHNAYYRVEKFTGYFTPPFLNWPLPNGTSTTHGVSSIVDHHGKQSYVKDGAILTYKGELATVTALGYGYRSITSSEVERCNNDPTSPNYFGGFTLAAYGKDNVGSAFDLPFPYDAKVSSSIADPKGLLWYDGHPGYDYPETKGTEIFAAADGYLIPSLCGGAFNQIAIQHINGYQTFYLHCDSWASAIQQAYNDQTPLKITAGTTIGYVGDKGVAPGAYHLHFEVHRYSTDNASYVLADPYGYFAGDQSAIDPPLWLPGQ